MGRRELYCSLKTRDEFIAIQKSYRLYEVSKKVLIVAKKDFLTPEEMQQVASKALTKALESFDQWNNSIQKLDRFEHMPSSEHEEHPNAPTEEEIVSKLINPDVAGPVEDPLFTFTDRMLAQEDIQISKGIPSYKDLVQKLRLVERHISELVHERCYNINPEPCRVITVPDELQVIEAEASEELTVLKVHKEFLDNAEFGESARKKHVQAIELWQEIIGDKPMSACTKEDARNVKRTVRMLPSHRKSKAKYKNKIISELIGMDIPDEDRLAPATVSHCLIDLQTFFGWAIDQDFVEGTNIFTGLTNIRDSQSAGEKRDAFSKKQLETLFSSSIYTGCKSVGRRFEVGEMIVKDSLYWLPLLGLYTGARLQEIAQIYVDDVREVEGVWVLDINANAVDKKLKNASSKRIIPLHKAVIDAGFLGYVESCNTRGMERVFFDIEQDGQGTYSGNFSKKFSRGLEALNIKTGKTSFHSFRHNFIDALRNNDTQQDVEYALSGHALSGVHFQYGSATNIERMNKAIQKIKYEGVE
jgi:integrase